MSAELDVARRLLAGLVVAQVVLVAGMVVAWWIERRGGVR